MRIAKGGLGMSRSNLRMPLTPTAAGMAQPLDDQEMAFCFCITVSQKL